MGNLQNLVENTTDYLQNDYPKFVELMKMGDIPDGEEIMTHARMMYGHVDWTDLIVELDELTNQLLMTCCATSNTAMVILKVFVISMTATKVLKIHLKKIHVSKLAKLL